MNQNQQSANQTRENKKKTEERLIFLSRFQEVFPNNPTWGRIEYYLQQSFTNVSVQIKRLYIIGNRNIESRYNALNQNKTELEIILSENQLNKSQDFNQICEKGFKHPLKFDYGKVQLKTIPKASQDFYQVMVCRAAIGNTYIYPSKNITESIPFEEKPQLMDQQFDSVYIYDENSTSKEFKSTYLIYETEKRCLPQFVVHFTIDSTRYREMQEKIICELCDDNVARKYCETQDTYLCITCDNSHHHHRLVHKHKRFEISEKPKILGDCPIHPSLKMQIYCTQCNRTLCLNCKVKGDHSSGQMLMHNLVRITQRYLATQKHLQQIDIDLQKRKKHILKQIGLVESKLSEINKKNDELQNKIYEIMQDALRKLEKITKHKMSMLMSDHIELKRQLDKIQWMQKYLLFEHDVLAPNDFLLSYSRYENMRKQMITNKFEISNIVANMRAQGYINILTEQQARMKSSSAPTNGLNDPQIIRKNETHKLNSMKKQNIFQKSELINDQVIKSKVNWNQPIQDRQQIVKSKNNLLNLSILKHI